MTDAISIPEGRHQQAAPSAPAMMAPNQPTVPVEPAAEPAKPVKGKRVRNRATGARRGPKPLTDAEKEQRQIARRMAEESQAEQAARRAQAMNQMARIAAIGSLTPALLTTAEIGAMSRFVLASVGPAPVEPSTGAEG